MEIIDFGRKDGTCLKCHRDLSVSEKRSGMPICGKCASGLADIIKGMINGDDLKEFSEDVSNFTDFITSSSKLMGLEDIVVIQVCFNIYMSMTRGMGRKNPIIAKKIFEDAKEFIDMELERLEKPERHERGVGDIFGKDKYGEEDPFGEMVSRLNDIMRKHNVADNKNDNIENKKDTGGEDIGNIKEGDADNKKDINDSKIDGNGEDGVTANNGCSKGSKRIKID